MPDNGHTEEKIPCSESIKNVTALVIKLFFIMALGSLLSIAHASDENTVSQIQLLLSLKGYDISYRNSNGIDGKIGSKTLEAISAYKETLPINKRNTTDLIDLKKILEDDVRSGNARPTLDKGNIEQSFKELKDELDKTKTDLNNLISKQSKQEKDYSKDMGLVNTGATFVLTVLGLLVALTSIGGIAAYKLIENKLQHNMDSRNIEILTEIYSSLSKAFYSYYREFFKNPENAAFKSGIELALRFNNNAKSHAEHLPSEKRQSYLINIKSHEAYHLGARKTDKDIEKALEIINDLKVYSAKLTKDGETDKWAEYMDTVAWVYIRSGDDKKIKEGKEIIKKILNDDHVRQEIKEEMRDNYKRIDRAANTWIDS